MSAKDDDILRQFGFENDEQLKRFINEAGNLKLPKGSSKEMAWQKLEQTIVSQSAVNRESKNISLRYFMLAAASIALLILGWWSINQWNHAIFSTGVRQTLAVGLPDGSMVTLNSQSIIQWKRWGWKHNRKVNFEGEALFKVEKGTRFVVESHQNSVSVLGTEFNVQARNNIFDVKCYQGKVSVSLPGEKPVVLTKGQAVKKEPGKPNVEQYTTDTNLKESWIKGEYYFDDTDIQLVFDELSRQFNVHVNYSLENRKYSGYFKNSSLDSALMNICLPLGLKYSIKSDSVIINK